VNNWLTLDLTENWIAQNIHPNNNKPSPLAFGPGGGFVYFYVV
jgi:hypothetical protein